MNFKNQITLIITLVFFVACKKNSPVPTSKKNTVVTGVYVAGYTIADNGYSQATYWKDGIPTILVTTVPNEITPSYAVDITTNGNDIYVAGYTTPGGYPTATYWKNGNETLLMANGLQTYGTCIYIKGSDIYIGGYTKNNNGPSQAVYWKNGVITHLPSDDKDFDTEVNCILVQGTDVYAAGQTNYKAAYWKNNTINLLTVGQLNAIGSVNSIASKGNDIYMVGNIQSFSNNEPTFAILWKNNTLNYLADTVENSSAISVNIQDNNVYIAGSVEKNHVSEPTYWKNSNPIKFTSAETFNYSELLSVDIIGSDLYILGRNPTYFTAYSKNDSIIRLPGVGHGDGTGIKMFVATAAK